MFTRPVTTTVGVVAPSAAVTTIEQECGSLSSMGSKIAYRDHAPANIYPQQ